MNKRTYLPYAGISILFFFSSTLTPYIFAQTDEDENRITLLPQYDGSQPIYKKTPQIADVNSESNESLAATQSLDMCRSTGQGTPSDGQYDYLKSADDYLNKLADILKQGNSAWNKYAKEHFSYLDKDTINLFKKGAQERLDNQSMSEIRDSQQNSYPYTKLVDEDIGISYEYPCNWLMSGAQVSYEARSFDVMSLNLYRIPGAANMDIREVIRIHSDVIDKYNSIIEPLDMHRYQVDGEEAGTMLYSPDTLELVRVVMTVHDGNAYYFEYTTQRNFYQEDYELMTHFFNSVKWLK